MTRRIRVSRKPALIALGCLLATAQISSGTIILQELFDAIAGPPPGSDAPLEGMGDTSTSIGMTDIWNAYGNLGIYTASNFNPGTGLPGLPSNKGEDGGLWNRAGGYATSIIATRPMVTPIDFSKEQTLYYSFIANNSGDTAMGIGFTTAPEDTFEFVGAGLSWNNARSLATGEIDASNAAYICYGVLGVDGGSYGIRNHEPMNSVNGAALVVVRLRTHASTPDQIDIKRYGVGDTIESDPSQVVWSASDEVDSSFTATNILLWLNGVSGNDAGELDAIRVGTTWADVTGASATSDPFTAWATGAPNNLSGADALPSADPDHDGIPNAVEFVVGGNPKAAGDQTKLPTGVIAGANYEFSFRRSDIANVAPLPTVEYSSNLIDWTTAQDGVGGVSIVATDDFYGTGVDRVVAKIPQSIATGSKLFARLNTRR